MKKMFLILAVGFLGISASAASLVSNSPPAGYPAVNGIVKRVDIDNKRISLKHDAIPNLDMPGMTMFFMVEDVALLQGLKAADQVLFSADQDEDGELVILWMKKIENVPASAANSVFCTGTYGTVRKIKVDVDIRKKSYSTIRYEDADGPYKGTTYINSIGHMFLTKKENSYSYRSSDSELATQVLFTATDDNKIHGAKLFKYGVSKNFVDINCRFAL